MNLSEILQKLKENALKVSQELQDFQLDKRDDFSINFQQLKSREGIEISLDEIELKDGVWSYQGHHVLLFIPDQWDIDKVIAGIEEGRKFHLSDCKTLTDMRNKGRIKRYQVTNNTEGIFKVHGISQKSREKRYAEVALHVCKNCLECLNYQDYNKKNYAHKQEVYHNFNLEEFFNSYQTYFKNLPADIGQDKAGYADDWDNISKQYRQSQRWCCEQCHVNLENHKRLLHTHHINGVKHDNSWHNLKALCTECHSRQHFHGHMKINHNDRQLLASLRIKQYNF